MQSQPLNDSKYNELEAELKALSADLSLPPPKAGVAYSPSKQSRRAIVSGEYQNVLLTSRNSRVKHSSQLSAQWLTRCRPDTKDIDSINSEPTTEHNSSLPKEPLLTECKESSEEIDALPDSTLYCGRLLGMDDTSWNSEKDTDSEEEHLPLKPRDELYPEPTTLEITISTGQLETDTQLDSLTIQSDGARTQQSSVQEIAVKNCNKNTAEVKCMDKPISKKLTSVFGIISAKDCISDSTDHDVVSKQWKFQCSNTNSTTHCSKKCSSAQTTPITTPLPVTMSTTPSNINCASSKTKIAHKNTVKHKDLLNRSKSKFSISTPNSSKEFDTFEFTDADLAELECIEEEISENSTTITASTEPKSTNKDPEHTISSSKKDLPVRTSTAVSDNFVRINLKAKHFSRKRSLTGSAHKRLAWKKLNKSRESVKDGRGPGRGGQDVCYKCGNAGHWAKNCAANVGSKNLGKFDGESVGFSDKMSSIDNEEIDDATLQQLANESPFPSLEDAVKMACGIPFKARTEGSLNDVDVPESFVAPPPSYSRPPPRPPAVEPLYSTQENSTIRGILSVLLHIKYSIVSVLC